MILIRELGAVPAHVKGGVLALGNFDGLHRGHKAILDETLARAKTLGAPAAVMTFTPHPREYFSPDAPKLRLMRTREKIDAFRAMGFDAVFLPHFNEKLAGTTSQDFIDTILVGDLGVRHVVTGEDFKFGAKRGGNAALLSECGKFGYTAVAHVNNGTAPVSSTAIRLLLSHGDLAAAAQFLGHPYAISGHVAHGDKRGRTLGFPTANVPMDKLFMPRAGVYKVKINGTLDGVANIGMRPTFDGKKPQAEVHIFDFASDIYGQYITIEPVRFLRDEMKFNSADELKKHILQDVEEARKP